MQTLKEELGTRLFFGENLYLLEVILNDGQHERIVYERQEKEDGSVVRLVMTDPDLENIPDYRLPWGLVQLVKRYAKSIFELPPNYVHGFKEKPS